MQACTKQRNIKGKSKWNDKCSDEDMLRVEQQFSKNQKNYRKD